MPDQSLTIVGNLTRDPELRYTTGGQAVTNMGIACSHRWQRKGSTEWEEDTTFFNITAWGPLGENCAATLVKGNRVVVTGRLQQRSYETKDGERKTVFDLIADEVAPSLKWATAKVEAIQREQLSRDDSDYRDAT